VPGVLLLPGGVPLTKEQAVSRLADEQPSGDKPAQCVAFIALGCLTVGCWDLPPASGRVHRDLVADEVNWLRREAADRHDMLVVLEGAGEQLTLTLPEFEAWYAAYQLPFVDYDIELETSPGNRSVARVRFRPSRSGIGPRRTLTSPEA